MRERNLKGIRRPGAIAGKGLLPSVFRGKERKPTKKQNKHNKKKKTGGGGGALINAHRPKGELSDPAPGRKKRGGDLEGRRADPDRKSRLKKSKKGGEKSKEI